MLDFAIRETHYIAFQIKYNLTHSEEKNVLIFLEGICLVILFNFFASFRLISKYKCLWEYISLHAWASLLTGVGYNKRHLPHLMYTKEVINVMFNNNYYFRFSYYLNVIILHISFSLMDECLFTKISKLTSVK